MLNLILTATTLVGFGLAIWQTVRAEQLNRRQRNYSWDRMVKAAGRIGNEVAAENFFPQVVLSLSDRAAIIAYLIEKQLPNRVPVITAAWDHGPVNSVWKLHGYERLPGGEELLPTEALSHIRDYRILVVDDYTRSGKTMANGRSLLIRLGFAENNIRTAAIVTSKVAKAAGTAPDYVDSESDQVRFSMPWGPVR